MRFQTSRGKKQKSPRVVVYGVEGIGKSTFAAQFPDPLFIDVEGSTTYLDVNRFDPAPSSWQGLLDMVRAVVDESPCGTLVVDTLDWAEQLCADAVCAKHNWESIAQPSYGQGYKALKAEFAKMLDLLTEVAERGVNVVCTAHAKITKFEQPDETGAYDRWSMKLTDTPNTSLAAMVKEWADAVLFANYETIVEHSDSGKAKARGSKRVLFTTHDATFDAKNRWGLPPKVAFDYSSIAEFVPVRPQDRAEAPTRAQGPQMPTQPQSLPRGASGSLGRLRQIMDLSGVSDEDVRRAVSLQGYATADTPLEAYRPELVDYLVASFDSVRAFIERSKQAQAS